MEKTNMGLAIFDYNDGCNGYGQTNGYGIDNCYGYSDNYGQGAGCGIFNYDFSVGEGEGIGSQLGRGDGCGNGAGIGYGLYSIDGGGDGSGMLHGYSSAYQIHDCILEAPEFVVAEENAWTAYHYIKKDEVGELVLRNGKTAKLGERLHEDKIDLCECGLHAGLSIEDAAKYAPKNSVLTRIKIWGRIKIGKDKIVGTDRKIIEILKI